MGTWVFGILPSSIGLTVIEIFLRQSLASISSPAISQQFEYKCSRSFPCAALVYSGSSMAVSADSKRRIVFGILPSRIALTDLN